MHLGAGVYRVQPGALCCRFRAKLRGLESVKWLYCLTRNSDSFVEVPHELFWLSDRENYEDI